MSSCTSLLEPDRWSLTSTLTDSISHIGSDIVNPVISEFDTDIDPYNEFVSDADDVDDDLSGLISPEIFDGADDPPEIVTGSESTDPNTENLAEVADCIAASDAGTDPETEIGELDPPETET